MPGNRPPDASGKTPYRSTAALRTFGWLPDGKGSVAQVRWTLPKRPVSSFFNAEGRLRRWRRRDPEQQRLERLRFQFNEGGGQYRTDFLAALTKRVF